ncbi:phosphatase PAP2 family protein [Paracrocinitomix mangrovi]|uniref:phosphatase PAP2 family protein n=1 Tax=Paracrocinitomix mangrovi TaxID=2862509 RepID=UPI001C8E33F5|nr:phosphatase PAP2 family protein [Paracrocinitomix mangrovi]UKN02179.1 phosphatase PAP2 family protein [Paracrocinitomix mangrovi]
MDLIRRMLPYFVVCMLFVLTLGILLTIADKKLLHLSTNAMVGGNWDSFFKYLTHVGDGLIAAIVIVTIPLINPKTYLPNFALGMSTFVISGLLAQFFKRVIFSTANRPIKIFGAENLNLVDGVSMHGSYSFPSGHSTAAFALFTFLAFYFRKNSKMQVILGFLAVLVAFSRVYLSQHFYEDILAGSILGIAVFFLCHWLYVKYVFKSDQLKA